MSGSDYLEISRNWKKERQYNLSLEELSVLEIKPEVFERTCEKSEISPCACEKSEKSEISPPNPDEVRSYLAKIRPYLSPSLHAISDDGLLLLVQWNARVALRRATDERQRGGADEASK
jgi:hypothetical protein